MQAQAPEDDLFLVRDASPFYLKLSESVLRETPGHLPLAAAVAGGYAQYAYAFVAFEAEKLTSSDVRAAHRLEVRAAALYRRALNHAFGALELRQPSLRNLLLDPHSKATIRPDEVAVAYWAAAAWGALISLSKDSPEVVADLPSAQRLASLAWSTEPRHDRGALATLMGSLEASRPGGNLLKARDYFDQAVLLGGEAAAGPYVAMAETLALPVHDRQAYEAWLQGAVVGPNGAITLDFSTDIDVLNYAYALEQLEAAFYVGVVTNGAFGSVFSAAEQRVLVDIRDHEVAHRDFFAAALGSAKIPGLTPKFETINFADRSSVLQTAKVFEDLGVSAYNGAARYIASEAYLGVAGKIVSVEARHASAIRDLLNNRSGDFAPNAFDMGNTPQAVLAAAGPFITESITVVNA